MLVSIILPTFNSALRIFDTIRAINAQTHDLLQVIVVDNYSTDGTLDLVKFREDICLKVIPQKKNGIWDAMNLGIDHADGDLLFFLNSDDIISSNAIETIVATYKATMCDVCFLPTYSAAGFLDKIKNNTYLGMHKYSPGHSASFSIKTGVHKKIGYYNVNTHHCADHEVFAKIKNSHYRVRIAQGVGAYGVFTQGGASSKSHYNEKVNEERHFRKSLKNYDDMLYCHIIYYIKYVYGKLLK